MKPETVFSNKFIHEFKLQSKREVQICRMESNYTQQGIPDIYICYQGVSCWVEIKVGDYSLSSLQISWHRQHRSAGGMVFTVTQKTEKGGNKYILDEKESIRYSFDSLIETVRTVIRVMEERRYAKIQESIRLFY